jgi:ribosomal protein S18 acetylase RimI-like enzyme
MQAPDHPSPAAAAPVGPAIDLRCRRLAPRHVHDLVAFLTRLAEAGDGRLFHPHPFTRQAVEQLAAPGRGDEYHVWTAGRDGPVVAYGMLRGWEEGYTVPSLGIAVDPQWRGQGIGRRLVTHLHVIAAARNAATVRLKVYRSNTAAIALYRSFGYEFRPFSEEEWLGLVNLSAVPARMAA